MISMVEMQIVNKKKYIPKDEFWNLIAVIQTLPGVFAINTALYVGYKLRGMKGALVAALGAALPSFVAILLISIFFTNFRENEYVERVFKGIRPCVIALIFVPAIRLIKNLKKSWKILWIPFVAAFLILWLKVSPILIIVVACVTAVLLEMYSYKKLNRQ